MQYSIVPGPLQNGIWQDVAGRQPAILINPKAGDSYRLLVRYKFQPETVQEYSIAVKPHWWQMPGFILSFIALSLLLLSGFLFYTQQRKNKRTAALKNEAFGKVLLELKAIRLQLNPHFIFNALSSIQGLINAGDILAANQYLSAFGKLMRNTLDNSEHLYSTLSQELALLDTYLKLEQLRFGFHYRIQVGGGISADAIEVPALLMQPLVENAVKHGVAALKATGTIEIEVENRQNNLIITIADNGKGMAEDAKPGHGLSLTESRIRLFNQLLKGDSIHKTFYSKSGKTIVELSFKNWLV